MCALTIAPVAVGVKIKLAPATIAESQSPD